MPFMQIIKSAKKRKCLDNKIQGVANKNPHESLRGELLIILVVVPIVVVVEISEHHYRA